MQRIDRSGCILIAPLKSPFFAHGRVVMVSPRVYPTIHSFANAEHGRVVSSQGLFGRTEGIPVREPCSRIHLIFRSSALGDEGVVLVSLGGTICMGAQPQFRLETGQS